MSDQEYKLSKGELKVLYSDILRGFSKLNSSFGTLFIKHFNILDISEIEAEFQKYFEIAKQKGVSTEEQLAEYYKNTGEWTDKNNKEISTLVSFIDNMKLSKTKLALEWQINQITKQINEETEKLKKLQSQKRALFDKSAESYANTKIYNIQIFNSLYKTPELKDKPFTFDEFDSLADNEFLVLSISYNIHANKFREENLKRIALSPFFLNSFCISKDNPLNFYGKPVSLLTFYQSELFNFGLHFKSIISEHPNSIPEELFNDPNELENWHNKSTSMKQTLDKAGAKSDGKGAISPVGATKKELEESGGQIIDLAALARKKGGSLSIIDGLEIFS